MDVEFKTSSGDIVVVHLKNDIPDDILICEKQKDRPVKLVIETKYVISNFIHEYLENYSDIPYLTCVGDLDSAKKFADFAEAMDGLKKLHNDGFTGFKINDYFELLQVKEYGNVKKICGFII